MEDILPEDEVGIAMLIRARAKDLENAIGHAARKGISVGLVLEQAHAIGVPIRGPSLRCSIMKRL